MTTLRLVRCIIKYCLCLAFAAALLWSHAGSIARADNIQPAYLGIKEFKPGAFQVVWKVPLGQNFPAGMRPLFPESFKASSPVSRVKMPNATIEKWTMVCGAGKLVGSTIRIEGLQESTSDALVRIQLADGYLHRVVLRPTEISMTVPDPEAAGDKRESAIMSALGSAYRFKYIFLFLAALLLSLTKAARKRGVMLCAVALIAGSLCGHALGQLPVHEKLFGEKTISEVEAKKILNGLLLNTYRAFILDKDEEIYDVLARSVAGEFLMDVYLQNRESLRMDATEGALSIIDRLDIKSIESVKRQKDGSIAIVADWDVYGSVRHWKHIHFRCNTYKAVLTIVPVDNYWKLAGMQILDEERVI